jgi:hypothetical protein
MAAAGVMVLFWSEAEAPGWPDSRGHEDHFVPEARADRRCLAGGKDQPVEACFIGLRRAPGHEIRDAIRVPGT